MLDLDIGIDSEYEKDDSFDTKIVSLKDWDSGLGQEIMSIQERAFPGLPTFPEDIMRNMIKFKGGLIVTICDSKNKVVGYSNLVATNSDTAQMESIAIDPDHQNKGLSKQLSESVEAELKRRNCKFYSLETKVGCKYAQSIEKNYADRIIETHELDSPVGKQTFYKIRL